MVRGEYDGFGGADYAFASRNCGGDAGMSGRSSKKPGEGDGS